MIGMLEQFERGTRTELFAERFQKTEVRQIITSSLQE